MLHLTPDQIPLILIGIGGAVYVTFKMIKVVGFGVCDCFCGPGKCDCGCACIKGCPCFQRDKDAESTRIRNHTGGSSSG